MKISQNTFLSPHVIGSVETFLLKSPDWEPPEDPIEPPSVIAASQISLIIPVKDNQSGIDRLLLSIEDVISPDNYPMEVIIVDNNSSTPLEVTGTYPFDVKVLRCKRIGPGAARNTGVNEAKGEWILFTDSDCVAMPSLIEGYLTNDNTCIAYSGMINIVGDDYLSRYYRDQNVLIPMALKNEFGIEPYSLVTANCLVLKEAILAAGGFDERFIYGGGEDTELGFRLRWLGGMRYNWKAESQHEFEDGIDGFIKRFIRYGKGSKMIEDIYKTPMQSGQIRANRDTRMDHYLAMLHTEALEWGYQLRNYDTFPMDEYTRRWQLTN